MSLSQISGFTRLLANAVRVLYHYFCTRYKQPAPSIIQSYAVIQTIQIQQNLANEIPHGPQQKYSICEVCSICEVPFSGILTLKYFLLKKQTLVFLKKFKAFFWLRKEITFSYIFLQKNQNKQLINYNMTRTT